ncbi:MAG: thioesterase family protein [Bacillota bacterium]|nr:thioesterase family protein [Bacillota bacterium]
MELALGNRYELRFVVEYRHSAASIGSGGLELLATPYMIAMMEGASFYCVEDRLPADKTTVGTLVDIKHLAATPIGAEVVATSELVEIDGRRLRFRVEARDAEDLIGEGYHERFIVETERFLNKLGDKDQRITQSK